MQNLLRASKDKTFWRVIILKGHGFIEEEAKEKLISPWWFFFTCNCWILLCIRYSLYIHHNKCKLLPSCLSYLCFVFFSLCFSTSLPIVLLAIIKFKSLCHLHFTLYFGIYVVFSLGLATYFSVLNVKGLWHLSFTHVLVFSCIFL